jgi:SAM-dependent methyltransferase
MQRAASGTGSAFRLASSSFAARKQPEFMNRRMVRCLGCDLVYVDEPPLQSELTDAYHKADYDSSSEADDAAATYMVGLRPLLALLPQAERALEIGAGTGILLDRLVDAGFSEVVGIEPSPAAIAAAPAHRRAWIRQGIFTEQAFEPEWFDLICCFMTMEHVRDPQIVAASARRLLRPGGAFAVVVHDYRSWVNRLLGRYSPIIDVQHMQLFSRRSIERLFHDLGYLDVTVRCFANCYRSTYWLRLAPLPVMAKTAMQKTLTTCRLDARKLAFNVGNLMAWGIRQ